MRKLKEYSILLYGSVDLKKCKNIIFVFLQNLFSPNLGKFMYFNETNVKLYLSY